MIIKYLGAVNLIWLGISLFFSKSTSMSSSEASSPSHISSFIAGLVTTLGNPKAILFYLSFFPAFIELSELSVGDVIFIYAITTAAIGGIMLCYAYLTHKARSVVSSGRGARVFRVCSGSMLVGSGVFVMAKS